MKKAATLILFIAIGAITAIAIGKEKRSATSKDKGFVLIELFSSEGCSSCPPAERLMHKLIHNADSASLPIYVIEFHVDYWDYLGWKDSLASHFYTQRQQDYGSYFKLSSVYTPQAIVNGRNEMVGSNEEKIDAEISQDLQNPSSGTINCKLHKTSGQKIEVEYSLTGEVSNSILNFALVESGIKTYIKKGENAGKTLLHDNAARVFRSIKLDSATGKVEIEIPPIDLSRSKLICFVQNASTMDVISAAQFPLN
jgi:hypothetical protein